MTDLIERMKASLVGVTDGPWDVGQGIAVQDEHSNTIALVRAREDRAFIAAARTLLPEAIEEIEELRTRSDLAQSTIKAAEAAAPDRVKIWPFTAVDRPDGERAWSGGHWGNLSATMPHGTEYIRADLAQSAIKAAEAAALRKAATNPTREECYSAALSRDHSLGLKSQEEQNDAILKAEWWFLAWRHRILALIDDQSALRAMKEKPND